MSRPLPLSLVQALGRRFTTGAKVVALSGGRTNAVWALRQPSPLVVKLFSEGGATPLFRNDPEAEWAVLQALSGSSLAPEPVARGVVSEGAWIAYRHVAGDSWQTGPGAVADALYAVHQYAEIDGLPRVPSGSETLDAQATALLHDCSGSGLADLSALKPKKGARAVDRFTLLHGDPVSANILQTRGRITLIDWQCPALGDPCDDLALFLSPAMQAVYRGAPLSEAEVAAFLAAYPDRAVVARYTELAPWYHWRMAAYCQWKIARGHKDYCPGLEVEVEALRQAPDSDARS